MPTIAQQRFFRAQPYEAVRRPLDFSEETINERMSRVLDEPTAISEEEFWDSLKPRALQSIQKRIEEWLEAEAMIETGGLLRYEHREMRLTHRSGHYIRRLQTSLGLIPELKVPKVRKKSKAARGWAILRAYKKHRATVDDLIRDIFLAGVSTRRVHEVLEPVLGRLYSAQMVSKSLKRMAGEVASWHRRPIADSWDYLMLDGIVLKIRIAGKVRKKTVLAARGIAVDEKGRVLKQEIIGYWFAKGESTAAWETFVHDLYKRGLKGSRLKMICIDGNAGLMNALDLVYPRVPKQRCWVHKMRNVVNHCRRKYQGLITDNARKIYKAEGEKQAIRAFQRFKALCKPIEPKAVLCIEKDLPELLHFYSQPVELWKKLRTTNAIERSFREVRRRVRTISVFSNESSCDRIIYGVITRLNEHWRRRSLKEFAKKT
jgi:putative transposase